MPGPHRSGRRIPLEPAAPRRLSLPARLLWAFVIPLVLVLSVVGVAATAALRQELVGQVDTRLAAAVDRSFLAAGKDDAGHSDWDGDGPDFLITPGQADGTLGALVQDGAVTEGAVIGSRG